MKKIIKLTIPTPFKVGPVNVYIVSDEALTLVDTGPRTDEAWNVLNQELKIRGYRLRDFDQILLTHHHVDHIGLVDRILQEKEIPVYGHPLTDPYVRKDEQFFSIREQFYMELYTSQGVPPQHLELARDIQKSYLQYLPKEKVLLNPLKENEHLPGSSKWKVLYTPGHAVSHLSLYNGENRTLIAGDHLIKHISSNAMIEPIYGQQERPRTLIEYRKSLTKLLEIPIQMVYSGHGEEIEDAHALINERYKKQEERCRIMLELVKEPKNAFQISAEMFPSHYVKELPLTMSEVIGHLDLLLENNWVEAFVENGIYYFQSTHAGKEVFV